MVKVLVHKRITWSRTVQRYMGNWAIMYKYLGFGVLKMIDFHLEFELLQSWYKSLS